MKTIVLVHPFPLSGDAFAAEVEALASLARVLTPTMRAASIEAMADDVARVLDEAGVEKAFVGGLSMGGYVSLAFARKYPERLQGLILGDTRAEPDSPEAKAQREKSIAQVHAGEVDAFVDGMLEKLLTPKTRSERPEIVAHVRTIAMSTPPSAIVDALRALRDRPDARPGLANIEVPTLVLVGKEDVVTPLEAAQTLHAGIAGSKLVVLPEAGHLSNLEAPAAFQKAIKEFL